MHLQEIWDSCAICPSQSAWCNAVVLIQKKDGGLHFCIDFWHLNACMKKDSYSLPRNQEALESLVGSSCFWCLDLKSGFWQIKMDESSKQYTAFTIGNLGFFKCDCMPFGLCNAPSHFLVVDAKLPRRAESDILPHLPRWHSCLLTHCLSVVFDWFREHNLKLKLLKCNFFKEKITYLAHRVSKERVQPSNLTLKAIAECTLPQTYKEACAFPGLVGHYRRFMNGFTHIAQPLNDHLTGEGASRKSEWVSLSEDALKAFEALKQVCIKAPVLAFADYTKTFLLETDASKDRLRAVLSQKQVDGWYHPFTYSSRTLTPHEKHYIWLSLSFWCWSGWLPNILRSTYPVNPSW